MTVVASNYERRPADLYETEPWATRAYTRFFPVQGLTIWEPAAGNHLISDTLFEAGAARVVTSDIIKYDEPHDFMFNFLDSKRAVQCGVDGIVTNPPYGKQNKDAVKFARLALTRCSGRIALLLTAKFDFGNTRNDLFRDNPRFAAKIALTDRLSWTLDGQTGKFWFGMTMPPIHILPVMAI